MSENCADGVLDWSTKWLVQDNKVVVEVEFERKDLAVAFADEMGERFSGA